MSFMATGELGANTPDERPPEPPVDCPQCDGALEVLRRDGEYLTRCSHCRLLCRMQGASLAPIAVQVPGRSWDPKLQAVLEERLGFRRWIRDEPPGRSRGDDAGGGSGPQAARADGVSVRRPARRAGPPS